MNEMGEATLVTDDESTATALVTDDELTALVTDDELTALVTDELNEMAIGEATEWGTKNASPTFKAGSEKKPSPHKREK